MKSSTLFISSTFLHTSCLLKEEFRNRRGLHQDRENSRNIALMPGSSAMSPNIMLGHQVPTRLGRMSVFLHPSYAEEGESLAAVVDVNVETHVRPYKFSFCGQYF